MKWISLAILIVIANLAHSQQVRSLSIGGNLFSGNYKSAGFTTKFDFKKEITKYEVSSTAMYRWSKQSKYGTSDLVQYEDESYLSLNLARRIGKFKLIGFTENERSYMRSIDLRSSVGLGAGYQIAKDSSIDIAISELILPEYYWSRENDSYNNSTLRASTRFKLEASNQTVKFSTVTLFQPAVFSTRKVSFSDNLNISSTNSIDFRVTKKITLGCIYIISYEGYPYYINKAVVPLQQTASMVFKYSF